MGVGCRASLGKHCKAIDIGQPTVGPLFSSDQVDNDLPLWAELSLLGLSCLVSVE
jgi:hypothetical protein